VDRRNDMRWIGRKMSRWEGGWQGASGGGRDYLIISGVISLVKRASEENWISRERKRDRE